MARGVPIGKGSAAYWKGWNPGAFGPELAAYRIEMGLSQQDLADRLKCHVNTIRNWEDAGVMPRRDKWAKLKALGFKRSFEAPELY